MRNLSKKHILIGLILFVLGLVGVISMLTTDIPIPAEAEEILRAQFNDEQIKLLLLINPTILLFVAVVLGIIFYSKVDLRVPVVEKIVGINHSINSKSIVVNGIAAGLISGILISIVGLIFTPLLPLEFKELGESIKLSLAARFLYGGLTEEILMRFGLMSFVTWFVFIITKKKNNTTYWTGIIVTTLLFALGHFPIAFQAVENPSVGLLSYILLGNSIGGLIFGWLYWKKGLESAFVAHFFTHLVMVTSENLLM